MPAQGDPPERVHALPTLPARPRDAHKGSLGSVLVIGGSDGMAGAPWLAAQAALRSGAGLVTLAVPASLAAGHEARATSIMTRSLPQAADGGLDPEGAGQALRGSRPPDAVLIGCGMGQSQSSGRFLAKLVAEHGGGLVIDADALRHLARREASLAGRAAPAVLTPHPGEMAALSGLPTATIQADREGTAAREAARRKAVVVLKGDPSVTTDGTRLAVNHTGNPGLATAGAGDVLAGVVAALVARGLLPFDAAQLAVYLHGLAGDLAARQRGEESMIADDVLAALPRAFQRFQRA